MYNGYNITVLKKSTALVDGTTRVFNARDLRVITPTATPEQDPHHTSPTHANLLKIKRLINLKPICNQFKSPLLKYALEKLS